MLLPVPPQRFDGVEFRGVSRKKFQPQPPLLLLYEFPYQFAAMAPQSVPDHQQLAANVALQMFQELHHLRTADGALKQTEIEIPPGHPSHGRQRLPVEVVLQHRRLSPWSPGAAAMRSLTQSAFVDEDDGAPFFSGFFLISGQRFRFHSAMATSSRSLARPLGRWQLHPIRRNNRHTCPG